MESRKRRHNTLGRVTYKVTPISSLFGAFSGIVLSVNKTSVPLIASHSLGCSSVTLLAASAVLCSGPRCWLLARVPLMRDFSLPCCRYSWSGEPLFLACPTLEVSEVPACSGCGGQRTFEFQLMPALVSMLSSPNLGKKPFADFSVK